MTSPMLPGAPVVGYLDDAHDLAAMRRLLNHCVETGENLVALVLGETAWPSARTMVTSGRAARVVVTSCLNPHHGEADVELIGSHRHGNGPARPTQLARLDAALSAAGVDVDQLLAVLRGGR